MSGAAISNKDFMMDAKNALMLLGQEIQSPGSILGPKNASSPKLIDEMYNFKPTPERYASRKVALLAVKNKKSVNEIAGEIKQKERELRAANYINKRFYEQFTPNVPKPEPITPFPTKKPATIVAPPPPPAPAPAPAPVPMAPAPAPAPVISAEQLAKLAKIKAAKEAQAKRDAEAKRQADALRAQQEADRLAREKAEKARKLKLAQQRAQQKAQQEAALKAQQEAEEEAKRQAALKAQQEAEEEAKRQAALKAQQEADLLAQQNAQQLAKQEAELTKQSKDMVSLLKTRIETIQKGISGIENLGEYTYNLPEFKDPEPYVDELSEIKDKLAQIELKGMFSKDSVLGFKELNEKLDKLEDSLGEYTSNLPEFNEPEPFEDNSKELDERAKRILEKLENEAKEYVAQQQKDIEYPLINAGEFKYDKVKIDGKLTPSEISAFQAVTFIDDYYDSGDNLFVTTWSPTETFVVGESELVFSGSNEIYNVDAILLYKSDNPIQGHDELNRVMIRYANFVKDRIAKLVLEDKIRKVCDKIVPGSGSLSLDDLIVNVIIKTVLNNDGITTLLDEDEDTQEEEQEERYLIQKYESLKKDYPSISKTFILMNNGSVPTDTNLTADNIDYEVRDWNDEPFEFIDSNSDLIPYLNHFVTVDSGNPLQSNWYRGLHIAVSNTMAASEQSGSDVLKAYLSFNAVETALNKLNPDKATELRTKIEKNKELREIGMVVYLFNEFFPVAQFGESITFNDIVDYVDESGSEKEEETPDEDLLEEAQDELEQELPAPVFNPDEGATMNPAVVQALEEQRSLRDRIVGADTFQELKAIEAENSVRAGMRSDYKPETNKKRLLMKLGLSTDGIEGTTIVSGMTGVTDVNATFQNIDEINDMKDNKTDKKRLRDYIKNNLIGDEKAPGNSTGFDKLKTRAIMVFERNFPSPTKLDDEGFEEAVEVGNDSDDFVSIGEAEDQPKESLDPFKVDLNKTLAKTTGAYLDKFVNSISYTLGIDSMALSGGTVADKKAYYEANLSYDKFLDTIVKDYDDSLSVEGQDETVRLTIKAINDYGNYGLNSETLTKDEKALVSFCLTLPTSPEDELDASIGIINEYEDYYGLDESDTAVEAFISLYKIYKNLK
jgi:hypothetical protein